MMYDNYINELIEKINRIDLQVLEGAVQALRSTYECGGIIFVMGNGGSAATANHFCADFEKNAIQNGGAKPRILSLSTSPEKILAYGNDYAFDRVFSEQLDCLGKEHDSAVFISASGNSPNIIKALDLAKNHNMNTVGLSGFMGGYLKDHAGICLHAEVDSYEIAEDLHSIFLHMIVCRFKEIYAAG